MPKSSFFVMEILSAITGPHLIWEPFRLYKTNLGFRELRDHRTTNPEFKQCITSWTAPEESVTRIKRVSPRKFYSMRKRYVQLDAIEIMCEERQDH